MQTNTQTKKNDFVASIWIVLGVAARLLPLPANMSPMTSISLFSGSQLSRGRAFLLTFGTLIISDLALAALRGHAAFGWWSVFTYSGFAATILAGQLLQKRPTALRGVGLLVASSFGFWLWTNFGIWFTGDHGLYPRTLEGLLACYAAAVPFLGNSLAGDLAWGFAFFMGFQAVRTFTVEKTAA